MENQFTIKLNKIDRLEGRWVEIFNARTHKRLSEVARAGSDLKSKQRDQIGQFLKIIGKKLSHKSSPNIL